jgi:GAF domain-containing protein
VGQRSDQRAQTLEDNQEVFAAGPCMQALTSGRPAVMHDATLERRWGEIALVFVEVHIRSGLSVPVDLGGGPIGTLDVYVADPPGLGRQRGNRPAGLCRGSGQPAQRGGQGPPAGGVGRPAPDRVGLPGA